MKIILPQNHILYTSSNDVRQICEPLRNYFNIAHFSFTRINSDLSRIRLDTNIEWNKFFFTKYYHYYQKNNLTEGQHWHSGYSVLHMLDAGECIIDSKQFGIGNGLVIANHMNGFTELAFFALSSNDDNSKVTKLLNNIDMLETFLKYFKYRCSRIINDAEKTPIKIPFLKDSQINNFSLDTFDRKNFLDDISITTKDHFHLTRRELECIQYLSQDMTIKEIARSLYISPRTVKEHLTNARSKVGCKRSATLIDIIKRSTLLNKIA